MFLRRRCSTLGGGANGPAWRRPFRRYLSPRCGARAGRCSAGTCLFAGQHGWICDRCPVLFPPPARSVPGRPNFNISKSFCRRLTALLAEHFVTWTVSNRFSCEEMRSLTRRLSRCGDARVSALGLSVSCGAFLGVGRGGGQVSANTPEALMPVH